MTNKVPTQTQKEFIMKLQLEYLTHRLRSQVYREERYAVLSAGIADKKRTKIVELGQKFGVPTMFETGLEAFVKEHFWNEHGLPNLQYKDAEQKRVQGNFDAWYLLYRGNVVEYNGADVAVISNDPPTGTVKILHGGYIWVNYDEITLKNEYNWE